MSLVNQMLRDLQQRKDRPPGSGPPQSERQRRLPFTFVIGSALVAVLALWWLSGVISGLVFSPEEPPVIAGPVPEQPAEQALPAPVAPAESPVATAANNVAAESDAAVAASPKSAPAAVAAASKPAPRPVAAPKPAPSRPKPTVARTAEPRRVTRTVARAQLHPDALPGAILTRSRSLSRTGVTVHTAPRLLSSGRTAYGRAEQSFQDGIRAYQANRNSAAISLLRKAIAVYPGHLSARALLADIYELTGRTGEAMYQLAEGLDIAPDHVPLKKRYARLLMDQGDHDAAAQVMLSHGLPEVGDDPEAHAMLASIYQGLGESFLAAQTYRNLLVAWPQTGAFWVGLGSALEQQGLSGEAQKAYERALGTSELSPDLADYARRKLTGKRS